MNMMQVKELIGDSSFTVFGRFHDNDIKLSFVAGSKVYEIELFPKGYSFSVYHMFDWNEELRKYETMHYHSHEFVENKQGLKKFKEWIISIIDHKTPNDVYDGNFLFIFDVNPMKQSLDANTKK